MAKDGTARGGRRIGSGSKSKSSKKELETALSYTSIREYLKTNGTLNAVPAEIIEAFDNSVIRYKQAEKILDKEGLTASHPTTGAPIANPMVGVSKTYLQMVYTAWANIWQIICTAQPCGSDDEMEGLLDV